MIHKVYSIWYDSKRLRNTQQPLKRNISASAFVETICDIFGSEAKEEFVEEIYYLILKDPSTTPDWSMIFGYSLDKAGISMY